MFIKVNDRLIPVADTSTNGVEKIYYDDKGNGYYDYEIEEILDNPFKLQGTSSCTYTPHDSSTPLYWEIKTSHELPTNSNIGFQLKTYEEWVKCARDIQIESKQTPIVYRSEKTCDTND